MPTASRDSGDEQRRRLSRGHPRGRPASNAGSLPRYLACDVPGISRPTPEEGRQAHAPEEEQVRRPAAPTGPPESALATLVRTLAVVHGRRGSTAPSSVSFPARSADAARDARELDQRVAELVGAELYAALQSGSDLRFEWWFGELLDAAVERVEQGDDPGRQRGRLAVARTGRPAR